MNNNEYKIDEMKHKDIVVFAVDDMPALLSSVVKMLEEQFTVLAFTNCNMALRALEKHTPSIFLLDIEMPLMDGYELASVIRKKMAFKDTPIIFLTAKNTRRDVITAVSHGGNDYIVKPVNKELLINKIWKHLS